MDDQLRSGLENFGILKMDGPFIMDWGGFICPLMAKTGFGFGERTMAGSGVTRQPGHSSGTMSVVTGSTFSFVKNRIRSFLIIPPADTGGKTNRTKIILR